MPGGGKLPKLPGRRNPPSRDGSNSGGQHHMEVMAPIVAPLGGMSSTVGFPVTFTLLQSG